MWIWFPPPSSSFPTRLSSLTLRRRSPSETLTVCASKLPEVSTAGCVGFSSAFSFLFYFFLSAHLCTFVLSRVGNPSCLLQGRQACWSERSPRGRRSSATQATSSRLRRRGCAMCWKKATCTSTLAICSGSTTRTLCIFRIGSVTLSGEL